MSSYLFYDLIEDVRVDEEKGLLVFNFELPGVKKEEINISSKGNILSIEVNSKTPLRDIEKNNSWRVKECYDLDKTEVLFKDGLLTLSIPLSDNSSFKKKIINIS
jgi:HSP20 family molecular chaperone IbpA